MNTYEKLIATKEVLLTQGWCQQAGWPGRDEDRIQGRRCLEGALAQVLWLDCSGDSGPYQLPVGWRADLVADSAYKLLTQCAREVTPEMIEYPNLPLFYFNDVNPYERVMAVLETAINRACRDMNVMEFKPTVFPKVSAKRLHPSDYQLAS